MRYAIIDADNNNWLYEADDINLAHEQLRFARRSGSKAILVQVIIGEDDDEVPDVFAGMFDEAT